MDPINVSRSGRIRKKSSKLADFESSDEIENHGGGAAGGSGSATPTMRRPRSANSSLDSIGALNQPKSSYMVDSIPPHQLLAEEEVKREEDEFKTEEEEYEDEDDFDMEAVEDIKEEDFDAIPFVGVDDDDDEEDDVANRVQAQVVYKEEGEEAEVDVENDGDDEGDERNLMIDERKRQPKKSLYFSEKTAKTKRNAEGEDVLSVAKIKKVATPARRKVCGKYCSVVGCYSAQGRDDVSFFRFPKRNPIQADLWTIALNRLNVVDKSPWRPNFKSSVLCGKHFVGGKPNNIQTNIDYVPSLFPKNHKSGINSSVLKRVIGCVEGSVGHWYRTVGVQTDQNNSSIEDETFEFSLISDSLTNDKATQANCTHPFVP